MNNKLLLYSTLAERAAERLTNSRENWTSFLTTAGRLYKYPFDEQLMIYSQRPEATACAPLETWNNPMNRYVKRGSKGIALIDTTSITPRLKYVFDYADTEDGRRNPQRPFIWELRGEHEALVMHALAEAYGADEGNLAEIIHKIAFGLATDYCTEHGEELRASAVGSFLDDYDDDSLYTAYLDAITISTAYSIMSRCGLEPDEYFIDEDFLPIFDFNTPKSVHELGTAASELSEQVLREIEITIKKYER